MHKKNGYNSLIQTNLKGLRYVLLQLTDPTVRPPTRPDQMAIWRFICLIISLFGGLSLKTLTSVIIVLLLFLIYLATLALPTVFLILKRWLPLIMATNLFVIPLFFTQQTQLALLLIARITLNLLILTYYQTTTSMQEILVALHLLRFSEQTLLIIKISLTNITQGAKTLIKLLEAYQIRQLTPQKLNFTTMAQMLGALFNQLETTSRAFADSIRVRQLNHETSPVSHRFQIYLLLGCLLTLAL